MGKSKKRAESHKRMYKSVLIVKKKAICLDSALNLKKVAIKKTKKKSLSKHIKETTMMTFGLRNYVSLLMNHLRIKRRKKKEKHNRKMNQEIKQNPEVKEHSVVDMEIAIKEKSRQRKMRTLKSV
jgi:hypothetical protein